MSRASEEPPGRPVSPGPAQPAATGLRAAVERLSAPLASRFRAVPPLAAFVVAVALIVGGLFAKGPVGFVLILVPVLFLLWVLYLGWPVVPRTERLMRMAVILLGLALAVIQLFPR